MILTEITDRVKRPGVSGLSLSSIIPEFSESALSLHDRLLAQHILDLPYLVADEQHIGQVEVVRGGP